MWLLAALLLLPAATMTMLLLRKGRHQIVVLILVGCILILVLIVGLDARRRTKPKFSDKGTNNRKLRLELPCAFALCGSPESSESEIKSMRYMLTYLR